MKMNEFICRRALRDINKKDGKLGKQKVKGNVTWRERIEKKTANDDMKDFKTFFSN